MSNPAVPGWMAEFAGASGDWGGRSYATIAALVEASPWAAPALRIVWQLLSELPIQHQTGPLDQPVTVGDSEWVALLRRPGGPRRRAVTWRDLTFRLVMGLYCGGEFFLVKRYPPDGPNAGRTRSLLWFTTDRLQMIDRDPYTGEPLRYHFTAGGASTLTVKAEDVLLIAIPSPVKAGETGDYDDRGTPLLLAGRRSMVKMQLGDAWNRNLSKGGGRVPGYFKPVGLQPGQTIDKGIVQEAQDKSDTRHVERQQSNLPMFLNGAYDFDSAGTTPKDADWLQAMLQDGRQTCGTIGISPRLIADVRAGSLTDAGVDSEVEAAYKLTIVPMGTFVLEKFSAFLLPDGDRFTFDFTAVPALADDMGQKMKEAREAIKDNLLSRKEGRVHCGYDPVEPDGLADDPEPVPREERAIIEVEAEPVEESPAAMLRRIALSGEGSIKSLVGMFGGSDARSEIEQAGKAAADAKPRR